MNIIETLYKMPERCIYAFVNNEDKKVFIGYSQNIIETISRNIKELKYRNSPMVADFGKLDFTIIETVDQKNMRLRYQYWMNHYRNNGWAFYRNFKAVDYQLKIGTKFFNYKMYIHVYLKTRGRKIITLGLFEKYADAQSFIETYYPTTVYEKIVVADNPATSRYLNG